MRLIELYEGKVKALLYQREWDRQNPEPNHDPKQHNHWPAPPAGSKFTVLVDGRPWGEFASKAAAWQAVQRSRIPKHLSIKIEQV